MLLMSPCLRAGYCPVPEFRMTMRKCKFTILAIAVLLQVHSGADYLLAQNSRIALGPQDAKTEPITRQKTLRGSITPEREWWDVLHYHLQVEQRVPGSRCRVSVPRASNRES